MKIILTFFIFCFANSLFAQALPCENTKYYHLTSEEGVEYILKVSLPNEYSEDKTYNSVYYLDGFGMSNIVLGAYSILNIYDQVIEDLVFIGISYPGNRENWISKRSYDFIPAKFKSLGNELEIMNNSNTGTNIKLNYKTEGFELNEETTGGGEQFLNFLDHSICPFINSNFKNLNDSKTLIGHSFAGLFSVYALQSRPKLFTNYIIISAALSLNSFEILQRNKFERIENFNPGLKIFNCYGELEPGLTKESNDRFSAIMSEECFNEIDYNLTTYPDEGHTSILKDAIYDGLKFIYEK